ncbi:MAG: hypothetical protein K8S00_07530 [Bacteroidales bacterium]|nr:hypothetical protein [Bacteroidales bacterium]
MKLISLPFIPSKKILKAFLIFLIFNTSVISQNTIYTTAGSDSACPGDLVIIPVNVIDCINIASISLKLGYDPSVLIYQGYKNPHPALASGMLLVNSSGTQIALSWFNFFQSVYVGTDTLIEYMFTYTGGTSQLNWDTATSGNCQYGSLNGSIIPALFFNGSVSQLGPQVVITNQPIDASVNQGVLASFSVSATGVNSYQWQVDRNDGNGFVDCYDGSIFNGSQTAILNIFSTTLLMNGWKFQCIVTGSCDSIISNIANLTVTSIFATIVTTIDSVSACTGNQIIIPVHVTNFIDVASLSHRITFDPAVLTYNGWQNQNPALVGFFLANSTVGNFAASWFNPVVPATIPDGILYEIIFTYNGGSCCLEWDLSQPSNNAYSHISGSSFPADWIDGCVENGGYSPNILTQPVDKTVNMNGTVSFTVVVDAASVYQWEESSDGGATWLTLSDGGVYSGTTTSVLTITGALTIMDQYRCVIYAPCNNMVTSISAILTIVPQNTIITTVNSITSCLGNNTIVPIHVTEFMGVYKFNLELYYNISWLTYNGYTNPLPELTTGIQFSITEPAPGKIVIEAESSDMYNGSFGDTVLVELLFTPLTSPALMVWGQANCWFKDSLLNSISAYYVDGAITSNPSPLADAGPDQTILYGTSTNLNGTVSGGSGSYTYSWTPTALLVDATVEDPTTVFLSTTTNFIFTATDAVTGCVSVSDTVIVILGSGPLFQANPQAIPDTICEGDIAMLQANPSGGSGVYTFSWTSNPPGFSSTQENPTASPLVSTWYILTVDDGYNTFTDSVLITVIPLPAVDAGPDATICYNNSYTMNGVATNYSTVLWTTAGDGIFDDSTIPGATYTTGASDISNGSVVLTFIVDGIYPCGAITDQMTLYIQQYLQVDLGNDTTILINNTLNLHAGNLGCTYLWSNSASTESIVVSSAIDTTINYSVTVSDNYGCVGIDSINVTYISSGVIITKVDSITVCQG